MDNALNKSGFEEVEYGRGLTIIKNDPFIRLVYDTDHFDFVFESNHIEIDEYASIFNFIEDTINELEYDPGFIKRIGTRYFFFIENCAFCEEITNSLMEKVPLGLIKKDDGAHLILRLTSGLYSNENEKWKVNLGYSSINKDFRPDIFKDSKIEVRDGMFIDIDLYKKYSKEDKFRYKAIKVDRIVNDNFSNGMKIADSLTKTFEGLKND